MEGSPRNANERGGGGGGILAFAERLFDDGEVAGDAAVCLAIVMRAKLMELQVTAISKVDIRLDPPYRLAHKPWPSIRGH